MKTLILLRAALIVVLLIIAVGSPVTSPVYAARLTQSGDGPSNPVYLPLLYQGFSAPVDMEEPNETRLAADGPLACGTLYTFDLLTQTDQDWYFFDTSSLGKINIELSDYNGPLTDMSLELYDSSGRPAAKSMNNNYLQPTENIDFLPLYQGRYYIHANRAEGTSTPNQTYKLKVTCNQAKNSSGDIWGVFKSKNLPAANVPVIIKIWTPFVNTIHTVQTMTDAQGKYHFWGMPSLDEGQTYEVQFENWNDQLGSSYAAFASKKDIEAYTAGSVQAMTDLDISPLTLLSPNSSAGHPFPITFTWVPRTTSPTESYAIYLWSTGGSYKQWNGPSLGHTNSYTLDLYDIQYYLDLGVTHNWVIRASNSGGDFVQSMPFEVKFLE